MLINKFILPLSLLLTLFACQPKSEKPVSEPKQEVEITKTGPIQKIETQHQKQAFLNHEAIQFDINIEFGGKERLDARITTLTNSTASLIELNNGEKIYINKNEVYCSPGLADSKSVRFDAYTWNYFFLFPYKLSDQGTIWSDFSSVTIGEKTFNTQKLTFSAGTGDAPDDWYIVHSDVASNLIDHAAYIVTAGKSKEKAEKDPHAIQYADYANVDGIPIAKNWIFWGWTKDAGLTNTIGKASLSNIKFIQNIKEKFEVPSGFVMK